LAATATALATGRTIGGTSFDGTANIAVALATNATNIITTDDSSDTTCNVVFVNDAAATQGAKTGTNLTFNASSGLLSAVGLTLSGDLTVNGTTTTISTTNTVVSDKLFELANGQSGTPSGDLGIIMERGSSNNAFIGFDESDDKFIVGTGSFTGASTGDLTVTLGTLKANLEGAGALTSLTMTGAIAMGGNDITNGGVIFLTEQADAESDVAGKGQIWVDTQTPNKLYFTDDAGTDFDLTSGGGDTIVHEFTNTTTTGYLGTASSFGTVGAGVRDIYIKKIDTYTEGVFTKIWKNGSAVEVQIA